MGGQPRQRGVQVRFGVGQRRPVNDATRGVDDRDRVAGAGPVPSGNSTVRSLSSRSRTVSRPSPVPHCWPSTGRTPHAGHRPRAPRAAGLKLAVVRQSNVAVPRRLPRRHDLPQCRSPPTTSPMKQRTISGLGQALAGPPLHVGPGRWVAAHAHHDRQVECAVGVAVQHRPHQAQARRSPGSRPITLVRRRVSPKVRSIRLVTGMKGGGCCLRPRIGCRWSPVGRGLRCDRPGQGHPGANAGRAGR
jgi:hypothetical protein